MVASWGQYVPHLHILSPTPELGAHCISNNPTAGLARSGRLDISVLEAWSGRPGERAAACLLWSGAGPKERLFLANSGLASSTAFGWGLRSVDRGI